MGKVNKMIKAFWEGWRVTEIRAYNLSKWGFTVQIGVDSTVYPNLMWVSVDSIELREVEE